MRPASRLTRSGLQPPSVSIFDRHLVSPGSIPSASSASNALEPRLWATLEHALEVVERDVRTSGITGELRLVTHDWDSRGLAWVKFQGGYHGNGIEPIAGSSAQGALVDVADAVQETIMELIWKVWPVCATHDHGLHAGYEHGMAVWRCTGDGTHTVASVGELPGSRRRLYGDARRSTDRRPVASELGQPCQTTWMISTTRRYSTIRYVIIPAPPLPKV
jgi:hypothetical protein